MYHCFLQPSIDVVPAEGDDQMEGQSFRTRLPEMVLLMQEVSQGRRGGCLELVEGNIMFLLLILQRLLI